MRHRVAAVHKVKSHLPSMGAACKLNMGDWYFGNHKVDY